uniref:Uncharacterized protein n=1 Tax=Cajanus cajan TaxID=3821 RepID=A0A151SII5_CAJCA|nr:hypothetical protein KK1_000805 [Cajanus cajan]
MRFHHIYVHNLVVLGKQSRRFLTNIDVIVTRVFKARYYSQQGDFLTARLGHTPSHVCRNTYTS